MVKVLLDAFDADDQREIVDVPVAAKKYSKLIERVLGELKRAEAKKRGKDRPLWAVPTKLEVIYEPTERFESLDGKTKLRLWIVHGITYRPNQASA